MTYRTRTDAADASSIQVTSHEAQNKSSHVRETQISVRSLNHQLIDCSSIFNWGLLKHGACGGEQLSHAPKADVEISSQTEEEGKPQIKDKQGTVKKHNEKPKCPNGQWEGIIDHTGLKLASRVLVDNNIKCTNVPEIAKLQNCKIKQCP